MVKRRTTLLERAPWSIWPRLQVHHWRHRRRLQPYARRFQHREGAADPSDPPGVRKAVPPLKHRNGLVQNTRAAGRESASSAVNDKRGWSPPELPETADDSCQVEVEPGGSCRREPTRTPTGSPLWEFFCGLRRQRPVRGSQRRGGAWPTSTAPFVGRSLIKTCRNVPIVAREIHGFWKSKSYLKKLIVALDHPEPSTAMRAVWLLQQLGDRRAVEPLKRLRGQDSGHLPAPCGLANTGRTGKIHTIGETDDEED